MRVNLSIDYFNTVFPEMNFSNNHQYQTTAFIVRVIVGTGGTNNIAAKLLPQRGAVNLQQFYFNTLQ